MCFCVFLLLHSLRRRLDNRNVRQSPPLHWSTIEWQPCCTYFGHFYSRFYTCSCVQIVLNALNYSRVYSTCKRIYNEYIFAIEMTKIRATWVPLRCRAMKWRTLPEVRHFISLQLSGTHVARILVISIAVSIVDNIQR